MVFLNLKCCALTVSRKRPREAVAQILRSIAQVSAVLRCEITVNFRFLNSCIQTARNGEKTNFKKRRKRSRGVLHLRTFATRSALYPLRYRGAQSRTRFPRVKLTSSSARKKVKFDQLFLNFVLGGLFLWTNLTEIIASSIRSESFVAFVQFVGKLNREQLSRQIDRQTDWQKFCGCGRYKRPRFARPKRAWGFRMCSGFETH